jgi:flagellar biosynthesis protein FlhF
MQIKKYRGKTIQEATSKVKQVFGPNAMIISTKKLEIDGEGAGFEITAMPPGDFTTTESDSPIDELKSELMTLKEIICLVHHADGFFEKLLMAPGILNMYAELIRTGINGVYARRLLENAGLLKEEPSLAYPCVRERTAKALHEVVRIRPPFDQESPRRVVAAFIGATGVGKTTTIAKLAAQLMLKDGKKVGLISIDTYRIGAMEQLKTYADILGIPCFQAFEKKDLAHAIRRLENKDVVLIDTAGQSPYNQARLNDLKNLLTSDSEICAHLLLSVGVQESEMANTAMNFSPLGYQSYIFTKVDESERRGSLINQIMKRNLPISYITTGQNVPEDIEPMKKSKIMELLFNTN